MLRLSIYSVLTGLFPAKAGPTNSIACIQWDLAGTPTCGTGFSREGVVRYAGDLQRTHRPFPAKAGPTNSIACMQWDLAGTPTCGTGFSREGVRCYTSASTAYSPASSRLKPVPLTASCASRETGWSPTKSIACIQWEHLTGAVIGIKPTRPPSHGVCPAVSSRLPQLLRWLAGSRVCGCFPRGG